MQTVTVQGETQRLYIECIVACLCVNMPAAEHLAKNTLEVYTLVYQYICKALARSLVAYALLGRCTYICMHVQY